METNCKITSIEELTEDVDTFLRELKRCKRTEEDFTSLDHSLTRLHAAVYTLSAIEGNALKLYNHMKAMVEEHLR